MSETKDGGAKTTKVSIRIGTNTFEAEGDPQAIRQAGIHFLTCALEPLENVMKESAEQMRQAGKSLEKTIACHRETVRKLELLEEKTKEKLAEREKEKK